MSELNNYYIYAERMNASIKDKLFFLPYLSNEVYNIVDYGCADGALGVALRGETRRNYYGYDIDKKMLDMAINNGISEYNLFYNFRELLNEIEPSESVLVLSSIIHEIYSYCGEYEINQFWERVFNSGFKQIVIRDMGLPNNKVAYGKVNPKSAVTLTNVILANNNDYVPMIYYKDYCQLLLKYWYTENWARESKENYFPITVSEVMDKVEQSKYKVDYHTTFRVPFVQEKVRKELGLEFEYDTHYKLILNL